jgi:hypothetical protein
MPLIQPIVAGLVILRQNIQLSCSNAFLIAEHTPGWSNRTRISFSGYGSDLFSKQRTMPQTPSDYMLPL